MNIDVEKFKELLYDFMMLDRAFLRVDFGLDKVEWEKANQKLKNKRKELIKMYEDGQVINCNDFKYKNYGLQGYRVEYMTGNGFYNCYWTGKVKEKDGKLITDDFIFIKG